MQIKHLPQIAKSDSIKNEPGTEPVFGAVESPCISGAMHRNPRRFRVFAPCVTPNNGWGAFGVYLKTIGIVDMHDFRTPRPSGFRDGYFLGHTNGGDYVKIFNINYQHTDYRGGICRG